MVVIGIDPGMSGAVAILADNGVVDGIDMPIMPKGSGKKQQVNPAGLADWLNGHFAAGLYGEYVVAYMERVSAMPKQGVSSTFAFGESYGVVRGVLAALGHPLELVTPQQWKRRFGLIGAEKDASRTKAIELYPDAPLYRKKDVGRADALLIARYGLELEAQRRAAA